MLAGIYQWQHTMDYTREFYSKPSSGSFAAIYANTKYPGSVFFNVSCQVETRRRRQLKALLDSIDLSKGLNKVAVLNTTI